MRIRDIQGIGVLGRDVSLCVNEVIKHAGCMRGLIEILTAYAERICQLIASVCGNMLHIDNYILYIM